MIRVGVIIDISCLFTICFLRSYIILMCSIKVNKDMNHNKVERTFYSPVGDYDMHFIFPTSELVPISQIEIVTWNNPRCVIT